MVSSETVSSLDGMSCEGQWIRLSGLWKGKCKFPLGNCRVGGWLLSWLNPKQAPHLSLPWAKHGPGRGQVLGEVVSALLPMSRAQGVCRILGLAVRMGHGKSWAQAKNGCEGQS